MPRLRVNEVEEADLAALIEELELAPVHLVGTSYGGSIARSLAARRPELVPSVAMHERPVLGIAEPGTTLGRLAGARHTFHGACHAPHLTRPAEHVSVNLTFVKTPFGTATTAQGATS